MAKIQRVTGKIFGGTATATGTDPQIGQFGSALAGTYLGTTDISAIQGLPAWGQGFIGAVTTDNQFPALPEVTGFGKVLSQQQCYLLQQGVAEWDSATTYYTGNFCAKNSVLYVSLTDENLNNDPESDTTNWELYASGSGGSYIGQLIFSILPQTEAGLHLLDGTIIDGAGVYSRFVDYIKNLYNDSPTASYFTTEADWQISVSTYGVCGKFVYNASANTVRLPKVTGILEGTIDASALGDLVEAGLPAHTHTRGDMNITGSISTFSQKGFTDGTGAFSSSFNNYGSNVGAGSAFGSGSYTLNASNSWTGSTSTPNYTADINTTGTVQPQTIKGYYYIVVATSTKTDIEVDIDNVVTDINGINTRCQILEDTTLKENQITNCLLEVPQNIKLELSNGVITLKAGSKVIIPNGFEADGTTKKFDELIIDRDINNGGQTSNNTWFMCYNTVADFTNVRTVSSSFSGDTQPTSSAQYQAWYDTANNIMKFTSDSWATWQKTSLPICICTSANEASYTSIDQVFNGFSYIGNHCFILPNVKGLIPNGRNENGSLRNIEYAQSQVKVERLNNNQTFYIGVGSGTSQSNNYVEQETEPTTNYTLWYKPSENIMYRKSGSGVVSVNPVFNALKVEVGSAGIKSIEPKQPFRAVDYSDYVVTPRIIETYVNGTSWYRVWSDGWKEQGGLVSIASGSNNRTVIITFLKSFQNTNYTINGVERASTGAGDYHMNSIKVIDSTNSTATIKIGFSQASAWSWYACGY